MGKLTCCTWLLLIVVSTAMAADDFTTVDLRPYFDNDGISFAKNLADGEFAYQLSYPAEEMPKPGRVEFAGVPFEFPSYKDGQKNCVRLIGKTIDLPDAPAGTIYFLGALFGPRPPEATIYYTDGSSERQLVLLGGLDQGSVKVLQTKLCHVANRIRDDAGWPLYVAAIYPQQSKPVDAIRFGNVHSGAILFDDVYNKAQALAITTSTGPPRGELAEKLPPFGIASIDWGLGQRGRNRARAEIVAAAGFAGELQLQWQCGQAKKSQSVRVEHQKPAVSQFDFDLAESSGISLTIADDKGRKITLAKRVSLKPLLVVRTERPIVLGDSSPIEAEVLVNVEAATLGEHRLELELVRHEKGKDGAVVASRTIRPLKRRRHVIQFAAARTPKGSYNIRGRLIRRDRQLAEAATGLIIRCRRPADGIRRVRFDTDGMMLVDGKRTFAIGMLANFGLSDVPELKSTGMNCLMIGGPTMSREAGLWELFDELHKAGILVVGSLRPRQDQFDIRRWMNLQREHPAIIGYHFLEEPGRAAKDSDIGIILQSYMTVRRLDPNHFVDMIDWPESSYWRYEPFVDVITPDSYTRGPMPTPGNTPNIVKDTILQIRQARDGCQNRKPVWIMPQMFSFLVEVSTGLTKDPSVPEGPTPEQVRLSGYSGIVGGATSILYFEYGYARNSNSGNWDGKSLWDASKHVLTEISQLRPVLEAVGQARTVKATTGIETWAKKHAGYWYVITVNSTEKPLQAQIDISELGVKGKPEVLFENGRKCRFARGRISDEFTADGAHVYRISSVE